ncbi:MAG TPA: molybdate ABC transporter substrate-binding protein [Burkholderiales bacterium]|nr:molybdate ABC transporter substrate-binding protein [Burkholderiales bacterium]
MRRLLACLVLGSVFAGPAQAKQTVTVAAAADLVYCMEELNAHFKRQDRDVEVVVSTGSSGTFFKQIANGAPFDVYLSADMSYPLRLVAEGLADGSSLTPYAIGRIVLWTPREDLDLQRGLELLRDDAVVRIAIANPEHAPYGKAAKAAMERAGVWKDVSEKVVYGQNIAQAMQFVVTGNADLGMVALSLAAAPAQRGKGHYALIPEQMHPRLEQGAVLTLAGSRNPAARRYLEFLRSPTAREIFERYGFMRPESAQ